MINILINSIQNSMQHIRLNISLNNTKCALSCPWSPTENYWNGLNSLFKEVSVRFWAWAWYQDFLVAEGLFRSSKLQTNNTVNLIFAGNCDNYICIIFNVVMTMESTFFGMMFQRNSFLPETPENSPTFSWFDENVTIPRLFFQNSLTFPWPWEK